MCGICGYTGQGAPGVIGWMTDTLAHRGPDDRGVHEEALSTPRRTGTRVVALGHRRLSVLDLSPAGRQPMFNESGDVAVVFNGEIYNFRDVRRDLVAAGHEFRSKSDSEVIVHGYEQWGEDVFSRLNGMFAIAVWDRQQQKLVIARDRVGIKPLYYYSDGDTFLFASELTAIRSHPTFRESIDRSALALYLDFSYVPAPHTIFEGVFKVLPGEVVVWQGDAVRAHRFWTLDPKPADPAGSIDPEKASSTFAALLLDSVKRRLVADVPVGAFLSGGYDSSLVAATMKAVAPGEVHTFSVGFDEDAFNEAPHARAVAAHLGTIHHERIVTAGEALDTLDDLARIFDEPLGDPSALPTYLVSRFTRANGIVVALSGDGGDELFCGYPRYRTTARLDRLASLPSPVRRFGRAVLRAAPSERARALAANTRFDSLADLYHNRMSTWKDGNAGALVIDPTGMAEIAFDDTLFRRLFHRFAGHETANLLSLVDIHTYLVDDILAKVDRASMAVALEVRVPLLDHRLVEFAVSLPLSLKEGRGRGKVLLRSLAESMIPRELLDRPKQGFAIPAAAWLRGPLRSRLLASLGRDRLAGEGLLDVAATERLVTDFLAGSSRSGRLVWSLFMLQLWLESSRPQKFKTRERMDGCSTQSVHADSELLPTGRRI